MKWIFSCLAVLALQNAMADDRAWVQSLPYAISEDRLYKVRIERIDGHDVAPATHYELVPGTHEIEVSLMLHIAWASDAGEQQGKQATRLIRLEAMPGMQYQLAARVDTSASEEAVERGAYWQAIVYSADEKPRKSPD
jgi:hypothetical protein